MTILTNRFSIEITGKDGENFRAESMSIPRGSEVSITSLPGDQATARVRAAVAVRQSGLIPVPHLAARRIGSLTELNELVERLTLEAAVDRFFVIAGDVRQSSGPFPDALALIGSGALTQPAIKKIGIAGYPDGHPSIPDDSLWAAIMSKHHLLTTMSVPYEIVTQFSFDSDAILAWLMRLREAGITAPVKIGVPGPASVKSLLRFAAVCGVSASSKVVAKYGFSIASLLGQTGPDALIIDLEENYRPSVHGDVSLHFYPFGGVRKAAEWVDKFRRKYESRKAADPTHKGREQA
jgi:methylenetetrahydrofolate reductase (NADPH)